MILFLWNMTVPAHAAPGFKMPFPCGEVWHSSTYSGHNAIDWNAYPTDNGREVIASLSGSASLGYDAGGWGYYVTIDHGNGWQTRYAHLQQNGRVSGAVDQGQRIGYVGSTGLSSAPHLHWEQIHHGVRQSTLYIDGSAAASGTSYTSSDPSYTSSNDCSGSWGGVGNATFRGSDTLTEGQQLLSNEYILSADGRFVLMMQTDGNLVLRGPGGKAIWASDTSGHPGAYLGMQSDGNMVIYRSGTALWASDTSSVKRLVMQTDGNLVARNALSGGGAVWASNTVKGSSWSHKGSDTLTNGQRLNAGQYLRSADKTRFAIMQYDGNFLLYGPGYMPYWATDTSGYSNAYLGVQSDGNIVLYAGGSPRWATDTGSAAKLIIQNDGNLVARTTSNSAVWASNTVN